MKLPSPSVLLSLALLLSVSNLLAGDPPAAAPADGEKSTPPFSDVADKALLAMKNRAEELKIHGVAVIAYSTGDQVAAWSSKMMVVGQMTNPPGPNKKGDNLLAIAYAKAAEMADTLKDSGNAGRPPLTGEFGWRGGKIAKAKGGFFIAAFSGGASEEDVKVSQAGLEAVEAGP
jgi:hypothetical protein